MSRHRGAIIAFLGTDGSGKTTILGEIVPRIEELTHRKTIVHHLKPDWLPPLGRLRGVKYEPGHVCTTPHASRPSGLVGSLLRISYLTTDYVLGYWLKVRRAVRRQDTACWIFDRYAYDMEIDPLRFRLKLPGLIIWAFLKLIPAPDCLICLGGDPQKIFLRKPETDIAEVTRQVELLRQLVARHPNAHWIDTTVSLETSVQKVWEIVQRQIV